MPKLIRCRQCNAAYKVPDTRTGAVPCQRCGASIPIVEGQDAAVPVVGSADDEAPRVPRPPLKHSIAEKPGQRRPVDDDIPVVRPRRRDDDDRRERPVRESSGGGWMVLIILAVIGLPLLLLCGGGVILGFVFWQRPSSAPATAAPSPVVVAADPQRMAPNNQPQPNPVGGGFPQGGMRPAQIPRLPDLAPDAFPRIGQPASPPIKLPDLPKTMPIGISPLPADNHNINLPGKVERVASGGGGRFLVVAFSDQNKVGVFDLNDLKVNYVDLPESSAWVAAGMQKFAVFLPARKKLRRYNLTDRKLELENDLDMQGEFSSCCMGNASAGPLLIVAGQPLSRTAHFVDLETLQEMSVPGKDIFSGATAAQDLYWPSASGRFFGSCWSNQGGGLRLSALSIENGIIERIDAGNHTWFVAPFADGKHVATGGSGVLTRDLKAVANTPLSLESGINLTHMFVPAQSGPYYMHVQTGAGLGGEKGQLENTAGTIVFYRLGSAAPLKTLRNVSVPRNEWPEHQEVAQYQSITLPHGIHFSPEAKALAVIPPARDKLVLYRVDLK